MRKTVKILHLEDLSSDAELIESALKKAKINPEILVVQNKRAFVKALNNFSYDIILSDHSLASFDSLEAIRLVKKAGITVPFLLVTATMTDIFAAKAMKEGACDYILKDRLHRLPSAVINSIEKHRLKEEQLAAHERLAFHIENTPLGFIEWDSQLHIKVLSKRAEEIFGWRLEDFSADGRSGYSQVYADDLPVVVKALEDLRTGLVKRNTTQHRNVTKDGTVIWCEWFNSVLKDKEGNIVTIMSLVQDITENKIAEEKLNKANRLYSFISQINQSIVHVKDENALFKNACRIALEFGKFKIAWVGIFGNEDKTITKVDQTGVYVDAIDKFKDEPLEVNGPQEYVLKSGKYYICNDILNEPDLVNWKPFAIKQRVCSCMILPVKKSGQVIGTFNLFAFAANFFNKEEITLLLEVTADISFALDVFEKEKVHRYTEELLIQNEKLFRALIEKSTDMITLSTLKGGVLYGSPSITNALGYTLKEYGSKSALDFINPDDVHAFIYNRIDISKTPGKSFYYQQRLLHKNGTWLWCEGTDTNMLEDTGIGAIVSNFRDISERKLAEENLLQSETRLKEAQAIAHIGNFEIDFSNRSEVWSDEMYKIVGLVKGEVTPSTQLFLSFVHPDDFMTVQKGFEECTKIFQNSTFDFRFIRKGGIMRYGYTQATFEFDRNQNPIRLFGTFQDVTEVKLGEIERTKMVNDLMRRNTELEQFGYMISHNLRGPVANIIGASSLLNDSGLSTEDKEILNEGINVSVMRLDDVVKDLNQILQVKTDINQTKEIVHFAALVDNIKISINNLIDKYSIEIKYDFVEINEFVTLRAYLYSIFYNLISNSIKYRRPQVHCIIEIKSRLVKNKLKFIFTDNGMGIDLKKNGDDIFGLYKRFHTNIEGKGMGLFMVKTQVEILGGKISVQSVENRGTEFIIEFESDFTG